MKVGLFVTCLVDVARPGIGFAALKLLLRASRADVPLQRVRAIAKSNVFNLSAIAALLRPARSPPRPPPTDQLILAFPGQ